MPPLQPKLRESASLISGISRRAKRKHPSEPDIGKQIDCHDNCAAIHMRKPIDNQIEPGPETDNDIGPPWRENNPISRGQLVGGKRPVPIDLVLPINAFPKERREPANFRRSFPCTFHRGRTNVSSRSIALHVARFVIEFEIQNLVPGRGAAPRRRAPRPPSYMRNDGLSKPASEKALPDQTTGRLASACHSLNRRCQQSTDRHLDLWGEYRRGL
jgi:hypothetical protein